MSDAIALYRTLDAMEPLLPQSAQPELEELACEILLYAGKLSGQVPAEITRHRIALLVRTMNSYYSNLIEGHKTLPRDIERAQRQDYSADPARRENQHLTKAHIEVEEAMIERLHAEPTLSVHSSDFLCWLHGEFYRRLPDELHFSKDRRGRPYRIEPGALRTFEVDVGRHQPPYSGALPGYLARFEAFYDSAEILPTRQLVAAAAAHHRLAWIHPFGDGNGRIARLHSHACLVRRKVDGFGLWTLSRGLARQRQQYYERLAAADQRRRNDFDGRGNLSDRALGDFCLFMLRTGRDRRPRDHSPRNRRRPPRLAQPERPALNRLLGANARKLFSQAVSGPAGHSGDVTFGRTAERTFSISTSAEHPCFQRGPGASSA